MPRTPQEIIPELTELADPLHEHLTALARAAAGAETVAPDGAYVISLSVMAERLIVSLSRPV
ncbi:hypothetical protein [Streptomyces sp. NPDC059649]|uniref:hypothetical protein n=1 Tax=Streptomyces sp. NPDC059649 TaxID=3346895 RepID=UPI0036A635B0